MMLEVYYAYLPFHHHAPDDDSDLDQPGEEEDIEIDITL